MAAPTHSHWNNLRELVDKLNAMTAGASRSLNSKPRLVLHDADAIVTHVEICGRHGVGRLVQMLFDGEPNILSIRSANLYGGRQEFGGLGLCLSHEDKSRDAVFCRVLDAVGRSTVKRVLCIPYFADDVRTALALKEIFGVPLCTYIMDDQNVCADGIPDDLMRELLAKSQLRLAISPELSTVYGLKYGCRMWYMPPLAPAGLVPSRLVAPPPEADARHGIVIGNIWGERWVELLRNTVRDSAVTLTWHCSGEFRWLKCSKEDLIADSILPRDPLPEDALIQTLRKTRFAVVPTGVLDESDDRRFIAQLSLPSRIPYMMAVSHIPILVLGSRHTGAAHFVEQFGIGAVAGYEKKAFVEAVDYITRPQVNLEMRRKALALAGRFTGVGAADWIWQSVARGEPIDGRYEDLMPPKRPDLSRLLSPRRAPDSQCGWMGPARAGERPIESIGAPGPRGIHLSGPAFPLVTSPDASQDPRAPVHAVVTVNEINDMHGTGPLVKRVFKGRCGIFSIRSRDHWGTHDFGDWHVKISQEGRTRAECFRRVLPVLAGRNIKSVTCVPFLADELLTSIAIKESFGVKMCVYIMDDQNVAVNLIPDDLMREFLEKCSLRLATHPELRDAYGRKYGLPFYILPAVVPAALVSVVPLPPVYDPREKRGALLGSFWDQSWFDQLCAAMEPCQYRIDWYGQNRSPWLKFPPENLKRAGITPFGILPEDRLAAELRKYPFVIVPCGALGGKEMNVGVSSLSLPGRILFAAATAHTPILLVGSDRSCGARFVERFGIGVTVPYDAARLAEAMKRLSEPQLQAEMRRKAAAIAGGLSDRGVVDWLAESIERGEPADSRFEDLFAGGCPARGPSRDNAARAATPGGQ